MRQKKKKTGFCFLANANVKQIVDLNKKDNATAHPQNNNRAKHPHTITHSVFFVVEYQETRRAPNEEVLEAPVLHDYFWMFVLVRNPNRTGSF